MDEKLWLLGDTHGGISHVVEALASASTLPQAIIFLGDMEPGRPFADEIAPLLAAGVDVRWIHGNHDTDTKQSWDNLAGAMDRNIDGQVIELAGVRVAGLGGVFRGEIWYPRTTEGEEPAYESYADYCRAQDKKRPLRLRKQAAKEASLRTFEHLPGANRQMVDEILFGKELTHLSTIFPDVFEHLAKQRADVLVCHEAPSCHPNGFPAIDALARAMGVRLVVHGHHHDALDYHASEAACGFRTIGVGLRGIADGAGNVIIVGEEDAAHAYRQERVKP